MKLQIPSKTLRISDPAPITPDMPTETQSRGSLHPDCSAFAARSQQLQQILRAAGYCKGDGVSTAGLKLVSTLARRHRLRDWPHTQTLSDYDALLEVTREHLLPNEKAQR